MKMALKKKAARFVTFTKSLICFLFSNLHRQVVIISSESGLSLIYQFLIIFAYILELAHHLVVSTALYYDFPAYFEIDVLYGALFYQTGAFRGRNFNFFFCLEALITWRLFILLYINSDPVVWSHLHDLVRNQAKVRLKLWKSQGKLFKLRSFSLKLEVAHKSSKRKYYSSLRVALRTHCALVCFACELFTTISLIFYNLSFFFILLSTSVNVLKVQHSFTVAQLLFTVVMILQIVPIIYIVLVMYFLVALTLYLVCHVYLDQYRVVNRKLSLAKVKEIKYNLNLITSNYRHSHSRLTAFILRYNSSTVSHIIATYLNLVVPVYALSPVLVYFQRSSLPDSFVRNLSLGLVINCLVLIVLTLAVARVNAEICRSGQTLGSILAKKGIKTKVRKRCNWVENSSSSFFDFKEALKLSTYYELIWRSEKELAFTAGKMNKPMNFKFIYEVYSQTGGEKGKVLTEFYLPLLCS